MYILFRGRILVPFTRPRRPLPIVPPPRVHRHAQPGLLMQAWRERMEKEAKEERELEWRLQAERGARERLEAAEEKARQELGVAEQRSWAVVRVVYRGEVAELYEWERKMRPGRPFPFPFYL